MSLRVEPIVEEQYASLAAMLADNGLLTDDLHGPHRHFYSFIDDNGWRVGAGGVEIYGEVAMLRSFMTTACHRGQGLGGQMLEELLARARRDGVREVYLFCEGADQFFAKHGFSAVSRDTAPAALKGVPEFAARSPKCKFMLRKIA